ncbi:MAG: hypothetical protein ACYC4L_19270 [Chloroflexota bacterium]
MVTELDCGQPLPGHAVNAANTTVGGGNGQVGAEWVVDETLEPLVSISGFAHCRDTRPEQRDLPWGELVALLTKHSEQQEKDGAMWSPATYAPDTTRANHNVEAISLLVADYDHDADYEQVKERLGDLEYVAYSTFSHSPETPRFRMTILLARPIPAQDYADFRARAEQHLLGSSADPATKDPSRAFYLPSCPLGAPRFAEHHRGEPLDPDSLPPALVRLVTQTPSAETKRVLGRETLEFVANGAPLGEQRLRAVRAARGYLSAGYSVEETAQAIWRGLQASPQDPEREPWTYAEAVSIAEDLAVKPPPPLRILALPLRPQGERELPRIDAGEQNLGVVTKAAWDALLAANDPARYFRFGGLPSRIEHDDQGAPIVRELQPDRMRHEMARAACWFKVVVSKEGSTEVPARPPTEVVRDVLASPDQPLPILRRITEVPVFASDGTLQTTPGYHPAARTYYAPAPGFSVPEIPTRPTAAEVERATNLLQEAMIDFPFIAESDRAHALAMVLLPYVRDLIRGPTPNHLIEAPTPGSGKSLLVDALLRPATGRAVGVIAQARDEDEWRKRITSCLREGRGVVLVDNVRRAIDSAVLAAALTSLTWDDRLLGRNETISVPVRCVWVTTANNPTLSTEIARRSIRIRLDPQVDRPWEREGFRHSDLRVWVDAQRAQLVWSALTLAQAWLAAGRPTSQVKPLGSYEDWSRVMGGILQNAGIAGFLGNLSEFYEVADAEGAVLRQFVAMWWHKHGPKAVGTSDLFALALEIDGLDLGRGSERSQRTALGTLLAKQRDRVIGAYRVLAAGTIRRSSLYQLVPTGEPIPDEGGPATGGQQDLSVNLVNLGEPFEPAAGPDEGAGSLALSEDRAVEVHRGSPGSPAAADEGEEDRYVEEWL